MDDDLIDTTGFELGLPSLVDMLRHERDLLQSELEVTRRDLRRAHQTIGGMIVTHREMDRALAALKIDHQRLSKLVEFYADRGEPAPGQMTYAYGNYNENGKSRAGE